MMFEHEHYGFGLPTLAVVFFVEIGLHQVAVFVGGAAVGRGYHRIDRQLITKQHMIRFTVVACVGKHLLKDHIPCHLIHQRPKFVGVRARPDAVMRTENQMRRTTHHDTEFGEASIDYRLRLRFALVFTRFSLAMGKVATGVIQIEPGRIGGGLIDKLRFARCEAIFIFVVQIKTYSQRLIQHVAMAALIEKFALSLLQGGEVRHFLQRKVLAKRRIIREDRRDAAIVCLMKLAQHQTGKQLRQREVLATKRTGISRQSPLPNFIRHRSHPPW